MVGAGDYPINPVFQIPNTKFKSGIGGTTNKVKYKKSRADGLADAPPPSPEQRRDGSLADLIKQLNATGLDIKVISPLVAGVTPIIAQGLTTELYINQILDGKSLSDQTVAITTMLGDVKTTAQNILTARASKTATAEPTGTTTTPTAPKLIMGMTYKKAGVVGVILTAIVIGLVALSD